MRLIVTRPEPEGTRTARALIRLGHDAILCPMLEIVTDPKAKIPGRDFQAVAVTSSNAVRALAGRSDDAVPRDLPLFAVGDQSALEAKRAGFAQARSAGGALGDLVALLAAELSPQAGPLLHAAGETQSGDFAGEMRARGFEVETAIVYRAEQAARLSGVAEDALKSGTADGVLFYSRRSAEAFAAALDASKIAPLPERVAFFCLSPGIAEPLSGGAGGTARIAEKPDQISLFAEIERARSGEPQEGNV
jgi:uroporphyrinogen-III synthase